MDKQKLPSRAEGKGSRMKLGILSWAEAKRILASYFRKVEPFEWGVAKTGGGHYPAFTFDKPVLKPDSDGGLWWRATEEGVGLHLFIHVELRNGKILFPLCFASPEGKKLALLVALTTRIKKYNEQDATILIGNSIGRWYPVRFPGPSSAILSFMARVFPDDYLSRFRAPDCPFCRHLKEGEV